MSGSKPDACTSLEVMCGGRDTVVTCEMAFDVTTTPSTSSCDCDEVDCAP